MYFCQHFFLDTLTLFSMSNIVFMNNLRKIRRAQGLSQQDLADKCKLAKTTISYYENNAVNPPIDKIEILAQALNVTIGDLLGRADISQKSEYEKIDPRILKKVIKLQSLPSKEQKKIWDYANTIIKNYELEEKQKQYQVNNNAAMVE